MKSENCIRRKKGSIRIDIISAVPQLLESPLNYSIVQRAKEKGLVYIQIHNLRDYATGKYKKIDDYFRKSSIVINLSSISSKDI